MSSPPFINYATKPKPKFEVTTQEQGESGITLQSEEIWRTLESTTSGRHGIFTQPISTTAPCLPSRAHDLQPKSISPSSISHLPVQTNKFYANLFLGSQKSQVYALPYVLKWSGHGLDIGHTDEEQRVFGPDSSASQTQYYFCPVGIVSVSLTAKEQPRVLELSQADQFSIFVSLRTSKDSQEALSLHIVRGSAFVSAQYQHLTPCITSDVMVRHMESMTIAGTTRKWRLMLEDGKVWLLYATGRESLNLEMISNREIRAQSTWSGLLQVAKLPTGDRAVESLFDCAAGSYPLTIELDGQITGHAQYKFGFRKVGPQPVLMYALPHHIESFDDCMSRKTYRNSLASQTNGNMILVWADEWIMQAELPTSTQLWSCPDVPDFCKDIIRATIEEDAAQDFETQIRADSMYFCGKALNKLAQLTLLATNLQSPTSSTLLSRLESNLLFFTRNEQQYGLLYDQTWGGIVSSQGFTNGNGSDFGNTWYNDHHYHYGYHIESAALYLQMAPNSVHRAEIERWAKDLIRDVASPVADSWFCSYRAMDWFVGHSWSKGLYESADGKDEESSSEDYNMSYAMYLFAKTIGDIAMADRAKIQLAVQRSSITTYMLFSQDNTVVPPQMHGNRVSGIKFENKIDYTTYFGANKEYIHGIHILPITPITPFFRQPDFVRAEWETKLNPLVRANPQMQPGWRGILFANLGMIEGPGEVTTVPYTTSLMCLGGEAWRYFMKKEPVDGGVCRSWYLAMICSAQVHA